MRQVGDIGILFALVSILIYTNVYFARSPWRSSILTIIFAIKNLLVVFLIGQVALAAFYPDYWGRDYFRLIDYYACGIAYLALSWQLWRMQSRERGEAQAVQLQMDSDEDQARAENETRAE